MTAYQPTAAEMDAMAERSKEFIDTMFEAGERLDLAPEVMISLFGFLAKLLARTNAEERGIPVGQAVTEVIAFFMSGLGARHVGLGDLPAELVAQLHQMDTGRADDEPLH